MKNFNEIYQNLQLNFEQESKAMNQKLKKKAIIRCTIIFVLGLIFSIGTSMVTMIAVIIIMLVVAIITIQSKERIDFYEGKIIKSLVSEFNEEFHLQYYPEQGIHHSIYDEAGFENYDRYRSEDLMTGDIEGNLLKLAEVETRVETTDEEGNTTDTINFIGIFGHMKLNKSINSYIRFRKNNELLFSKKTQVELDSSEFEKYFDIESNNKMVTMQILTPDFMEEIINKIKYKILPEIIINNDNIFIRIMKGEIFKPKLTKDLLDYDSLKREFETIDNCLSILKELIVKINEI